MLMELILNFDKMSRAAIAGGADLRKLNAIPAKEKIGRAKTVPADQYKEEYTKIGVEMKAQIEAIALGGVDE